MVEELVLVLIDLKCTVLIYRPVLNQERCRMVVGVLSALGVNAQRLVEQGIVYAAEFAMILSHKTVVLNVVGVTLNMNRVIRTNARKFKN